MSSIPQRTLPSVIRAALLLVSTSVAQETIPNINYVGKGYDILVGNPRPTIESSDDGWQSNVFDQDHTAGKTRNIDGVEYLIPEDYEPSSCKRCSVDFQTSDLMSARDYQESLSVDVKANFKGWGASFKASAGYREVEEGSNSLNTQVIESTAKCIVFCVSVTDNATPRITDNFAGAVRNLPVQYDKVAYMNFISDFGTHYAKRVNLGVLAGSKIEITASSYESLKNSDIDVAAAASYKGMGISVDGSASLAVTKSQNEQFEAALSSITKYQYGGSFVNAQPGDSTVKLAQQWYNESKSSPLPLSFELEQLSTLLTAETFPGEPLINEKRRNLLTALNIYCEHLDEIREFDIECFTAEYEVKYDGPFGGETDGTIRGEEFSDHELWDANGLPMMKQLDMSFDPDIKGQPLTGVRAHYYSGLDRIDRYPVHGSSQLDVDELVLETVLGRNEREYITSVEVCTYDTMSYTGVPTRRIGQLAFETSANHEHPKVFRGKDILHYVNTPLTWHEAADNCEEMGGTLVSGVNDETYNEVGDFAKDAIEELDADDENGRNEIWLHINDIAREGNVVWHDAQGTTVDGYVDHFPTGDINAVVNTDKNDCVARDLEKGTDDSWSWEPCTDKRYSVCRAPEVHDFTCERVDFESRLGLLFLSGTSTVASTYHENVYYKAYLETLKFHSYLEHVIEEEPLVDDVFDSENVNGSAAKASMQLLTTTLICISALNVLVF